MIDCKKVHCKHEVSGGFFSNPTPFMLFDHYQYLYAYINIHKSASSSGNSQTKTTVH